MLQQNYPYFRPVASISNKSLILLLSDDLKIDYLITLIIEPYLPAINQEGHFFYQKY